MPAVARQFDAVDVPVEYLLRVTERGQNRVNAAVAGQPDIVPANLSAIVSEYSAAQCFRQQLGAETDSEYGHVAIKRVAQDLDLARKIRVAMRFIDVHWAAQRDNGGVSIEHDRRLRLSAEVHVAYAEPRRFQQGVEST